MYQVTLWFYPSNTKMQLVVAFPSEYIARCAAKQVAASE